MQANDSALRLARELYTAGAQSYLAVLDAETALYNAQDQLAQSRLNRVIGFVSLYKALGGGWQDNEGRPEGSALETKGTSNRSASGRESNWMGISVGKEAPEFKAEAYHKGAVRNIRLKD